MWINLEDIIVSDISQSPKDKHCMTPLTRSNRQTQGTRVEWAGAGHADVLFNGQFRRLEGLSSATQHRFSRRYRTVHLKFERADLVLSILITTKQFF